jgi:GrpB-like predicted nucleotidyltransferase (UPF0157 family)
MIGDLDKLTTGELGKLFPIKITEYNPDWKRLFVSEKEIIQRTVGTRNIIRIEHIGSTAIPGLCAKPTIDILVEIKDDADTGLIINKLKQAGYHFIHKPENPPPHMMFAKGYSIKGYRGQAFHIHLRYGGDWDEILFRDFLIRNQKSAKEYAELKLKLETYYFNDREKYTNNKTEFITRIVKKAREGFRNKE